MSSGTTNVNCQEQSQDQSNRQNGNPTPVEDNHHLKFEFISREKVAPLNRRQQEIYCQKRKRFVSYLRERGKTPHREIGYAPDSVKSMARRVQQVFEFVWHDLGQVTTDLSHDHADEFVEAMRTDDVRQSDGNRYSEDSKRKVCDALESWFEWQGDPWEPAVTFNSDEPRDNSDPFTKAEMEQLWQASLDYKSVPSYNNLDPEERDRWKAHIAQELGISKDEVKPAHWEELNTSWKIPSLIRTTREAGWRCAMIGRLKVQWYDSEKQTIKIPREAAVKNNKRWRQKLSDEAAQTLERWLDQRANKTKYDGRNEIWLNRESNPYTSKNLNSLLDDLMEKAGINANGRKLTWHSIRHYVGTYTYQEYKDLKMVAEVLRQKTKSSAERYVHVPEEMKGEAASHL